ncbi:protein Flattop isoform X2 [Grus americana]|uniref:protein Flattop isoform X2 n=1 Tax=Grus americana TaxID=9117 RepID=UPI002407B9B6|nr:protein Flattop isoform X2 [Grus americana]
MAARYGAGQYEDAFSPHRLQNWSVPRTGRQRPSLLEGSTLIIADDRGHLLPAVPRSQASPWGRFVGTWEMPPRIPPARLDLTSRSAAAAARLTDWIRQPTALTRASNGLRTRITGKPQEPRSDVQTTKEPSRRSSQASSEGIQPAGASPRALLEEPPGPRAGATASLSCKPSCTEVRLKPAVTDLQHGDTGSPNIPASIHPTPRETSPRTATSPQVSAPSRGGSAEAEPRGGQSPQAQGFTSRGMEEGGSAAGVMARQL